MGGGGRKLHDRQHRQCTTVLEQTYDLEDATALRGPSKRLLPLRIDHPG